MPDLEVIYLSPYDLTPYENNTRKHTVEDIDGIKKSIEDTGFNDPIGIWGENNLIVEGHGRRIAAIEMGLEKVPCIRLDHLTEEQRKEYAIRHNRSAEKSEWDMSKLEEELAALSIAGVDMSGLFDEENDSDGETAKQDKPEVEFSEILGEENNYLILQFKSEIDWINACTVFNVGKVMRHSTRKDGKVSDSMKMTGTARVLDGAKAIRQILGDV